MPYIIFANLSTGQWVGIGAGIAGVISLLITIATLIYKAGRSSGKLENVEKDIKENVKPELKSLRDIVTSEMKDISTKLAEILQSMNLKQVSKAESPRALNDFGKQVLRESGIHGIVEPELEQIVATVESKNPQNPYQVQEMLLDIVQDLKDDDNLKDSIEKAAFKSGVSVDTVLLVAGIDIRDNVLEKLNMSKDDIDSHQPKQD